MMNVLENVKRNKVLGGFKAFLLKQNVLALALGVVIGGAAGKLVTGIVDGIVMPLIGIILPGGDWKTAELKLTATSSLKYGDVLGRSLDFIVVAFVVYMLTRYFFRLEQAAPPPPPTKTCPACLESIPEGARRCRACTEPQL